MRRSHSSLTTIKLTRFKFTIYDGLWNLLGQAVRLIKMAEETVMTNDAPTEDDYGLFADSLADIEVMVGDMCHRDCTIILAESPSRLPNLVARAKKIIEEDIPRAAEGAEVVDGEDRYLSLYVSAQLLKITSARFDTLPDLLNALTNAGEVDYPEERAIHNAIKDWMVSHVCCDLEHAISNDVIKLTSVTQDGAVGLKRGMDNTDCHGGAQETTKPHANHSSPPRGRVP